MIISGLFSLINIGNGFGLSHFMILNDIFYILVSGMILSGHNCIIRTTTFQYFYDALLGKDYFDIQEALEFFFKASYFLPLLAQLFSLKET